MARAFTQLSIRSHCTDIFDIEGNRSLTRPGRQISFEPIHYPRAQQDPTNFGLSPYQHSHSSTTLQNGGSPSVETINPEGRLYRQDRLEGCLCRSSHAPTISQVFVIQTPRYYLPLYVVSLRNELIPTSLREIDTFRIRIPPSTGYSFDQLSGGHLCAREKQTGMH